MEDDNKRMIDAARRKARRLAKKTDLSYQQALDKVARNLGREHWAAYAANPVEVPRDVPEDDVHGIYGMTIEDPDKEDALKGLRFPDDWNAAPWERPEDMEVLPRVPSYNALGPMVMPEDLAGRLAHLNKVAELLITPWSSGYFSQRGQGVLRTFLLIETLKAEDEGRTPSIPATIDWINQGLRAASDRNDALRDQAHHQQKRLRSPDSLAEWLDELVVSYGSRDGSNTVTREIGELSDMAPNERSGVLGTMDKALILFRNPQIRAMNA